MSGNPSRELVVELGERSYPIYIGEGLLAGFGRTAEKHGLPKKSPILVVTDEKIAPLYLERVVASLREAGYEAASHVIESGEQAKRLEVLGDVVTTALETGLDRDSTIVALGGGVVGDLAGFAAASYMRGVRFVQAPTTILAHDSSVGGKVAVNHPLAKNIIGAFHQPEFVLYDTETLRSLPAREVRSGLAEVAKHGLIKDRAFALWCDENAEKLLALDPEALAYALYVGCGVKARVVSQDEREGGLRAILNLGHTIGHALEAVAGYGELTHGEAISIGMCGSARLAEKLGVAKEPVYGPTRKLLAKLGLPVALPAHFDTDAIMEAMMHDKKFRGGQMVFVLPQEIGAVDIAKGIASTLVRDVVESLKQGESE
ncbi:3-dehydroquinate synthase [Paenibacillus antri]|uniref:3-dehydroquinate synthase n=1 Tax=Paenibacillus antri TaxID=2582848 RepID=A0A5R9GG27_9BACL|nr:3-dehydroquinate synthase [Paenibacillus antri]TLS53100.1 3-dehydroquinate synthase [Paenibacillus antri]